MSDQPPQKNGYTPRIVMMGVLLALLANLVLVMLINPAPSPELAEMGEAMHWMHESHTTRPKQAKLAQGALAGMAETLRDPHTVFMAEDEATQWQASLHGEKELRPALPGPATPASWLLDAKQGIGYAALGRFTDHSATALAEAIKHMQAEAPAGLKGIILDLRGNPGGYLAQACDSAGLFLPKDTLVASVRGPAFANRAFFTGQPALTDAPLVVLIDARSASAAEVLAGALQDHQRALIVGSRSFGKGCVQSVKELPVLRGKLKLTTAYYFLPSGRCIHRTGKSDFGIAPSPGGQIGMSPAEAGAQATTRQLAPSLHPLANPDAVISAAFLREKLHDAPLAGAYAALLEKNTSGQWPRVGDDPALSTQDDPHWHLREEIKNTESRLKQLRQELATPAAHP